jgi:hypothetical protein
MRYCSQHHLLTHLSFQFQMQVTFDDVSKVAYLIGSNSVHVIDVSSAAVDVTSSTAKVLPVLLTRDLPTTITDVVMCGDLIAISAEGASKVSPGQVLLYSRYLRSGGADSLKLMANFTVGELLTGGGGAVCLRQLGSLDCCIKTASSFPPLVTKTNGE